jgi:aerobic carbon-monoxide dehydrogenase medium subunit
VKPSSFGYVRAESVDHATSILARDPDGCKVIAGGQSLLPLMRFRLTSVDRLIDIGTLDELAGVQVDAGVLRIGAMTRQAALQRDPQVSAHAPLLAEAIPWIAHPPIRNRGTIGGSLAHADRAAELPAVAVALDASVHVASVRGERTLAADDLFVSDYVTALADDEVLTAVEVPIAVGDEATALLEISRRPGDFALAGVAVRLRGTAERCEAARCVAFGVGPTPVRIRAVEQALVGGELRDDAIAAAAELIPDALAPNSDVHASADYRREAATVLGRRALRQARDRLDVAAGAAPGVWA